MTNGWDGADPVQQDDGLGTFYELATRFTANANITITAVRVWAGLSLNLGSRNAYLWNTSGTILRTIDIDDTLNAGWNTFDLVSPLDITSGTSFDVSYSTRQYYGAVSGAYPNDSSDGNVTAIAGRFAESNGTFPNNSTGTFYGIDIVYSLTGGNQPPEVTGIVIAKSGATVQATATIDDESPAGVTLRWEWGDGQATNTNAGITTASHTYTASGNYAVLVTATDSASLTGTGAKAVQITIPGAYTQDEAWLDDVFDAVVSDVQRSGYFEKVNKHEPKLLQRTRMTAAVWVQSIDPLPLISGLAATSARVVFMLRLYQNFISEPQDAIDPLMIRAASNIMRRYHDDFDFEGTIRNVDLLGAYGVALAGTAGYLEDGGKHYRVIDITVPCIISDVWPQVN